MNLVILFIPFLQLGVNWWVTISLLAAIYFAIRVVRIRETQSAFIDSVLLCTLAGMLLSIAVTSQSTHHDLIRVFREGLLLLLFVQFSTGSLIINSQSLHALPKFLFCTSAIELLFTAIQFFRLRQGSFFTLPPELYGDRGGILPSFQDLIYSPIRPTGTFSEPSYLGLICIGLLICALSIKSQDKMRLTLLAMNSLTILLSQSKLGYAGLIIVLAIIMRKRSALRKIRFIDLLILFSLTILIVYLLKSSGAQTSSSFGSRFRAPFNIVPSFVMENPFGFPFHLHTSSLVNSKENLIWNDILHNSFYNFIFSYGISFVLIIFLIYWPVRKDPMLILFITLAIIQNGSFLDFDKLVFCSTVCLLRSQRSKLGQIHEI